MTVDDVAAIRRWDDDKDSKHPVKMCIEQRDTEDLVNVSSKYIGDHQSLLWFLLLSISSFPRFFFLISFVPRKNYCIVWRLHKKQSSRGGRQKNDKILNSFSLSLAFFLHKGDCEFSEIDGEPLLLPKREMKSKFLS